MQEENTQTGKEIGSKADMEKLKAMGAAINKSMRGMQTTLMFIPLSLSIAIEEILPTNPELYYEMKSNAKSFVEALELALPEIKTVLNAMK